MSGRLGYIGVDQHGATYTLIKNKHPRGQLLSLLGRKSCEKMYKDFSDGSTKHVGYVVGGLWVHIFEVHEWKQ